MKWLMRRMARLEMGATSFFMRSTTSALSQTISSTSSVRKSRTVRSKTSGSSKQQYGRPVGVAVRGDDVPLFQQDAEVTNDVAGALGRRLPCAG